MFYKEPSKTSEKQFKGIIYFKYLVFTPFFFLYNKVIIVPQARLSEHTLINTHFGFVRLHYGVDNLIYSFIKKTTNATVWLP